ncbi:MAG: hypothetical protein C5B56_00660 [Proteobacteria bacterium]|jgi:hypothetical protein|nr:MAG: hypothetical protein C5B56_00660 [Pseudomonadota bacterium]
MGARHISTNLVTSSSRNATARQVNLALSIYAGRKRPTLKMLARLVGLSPQSLYQARFRRRHHHHGVGRKANGHNGHHQPQPSLAEHLASATPEERLDAARAYGIEHIWDEMISPLVAADRVAAE